MEKAETTIAALSWQELLARVHFDESVRRWAEQKHGLVAAG